MIVRLRQDSLTSSESISMNEMNLKGLHFSAISLPIGLRSIWFLTLEADRGIAFSLKWADLARSIILQPKKLILFISIVYITIYRIVIIPLKINNHCSYCRPPEVEFDNLMSMILGLRSESLGPIMGAIDFLLMQNASFYCPLPLDLGLTIQSNANPYQLPSSHWKRKSAASAIHMIMAAQSPHTPLACAWSRFPHPRPDRPATQRSAKPGTHTILHTNKSSRISPSFVVKNRIMPL